MTQNAHDVKKRPKGQYIKRYIEIKKHTFAQEVEALLDTLKIPEKNAFLFVVAADEIGCFERTTANCTPLLALMSHRHVELLNEKVLQAINSLKQAEGVPQEQEERQ